MAANDWELRLSRMESFEAIRQLIATYAIGADRKNDPKILQPLFSDDAVWEADDIAYLEGNDVIAAGLSALANEFVTWSIHYMISPKINVDDAARTATCRWYLWELCTMQQADGVRADTWYGGWYDSRLSVHEGKWLFDWIKLVPRVASPNEMPWAGKAYGDVDLPTT